MDLTLDTWTTGPMVIFRSWESSRSLVGNGEWENGQPLCYNLRSNIHTAYSTQGPRRTDGTDNGAHCILARSKTLAAEALRSCPLIRAVTSICARLITNQLHRKRRVPDLLEFTQGGVCWVVTSKAVPPWHKRCSSDIGGCRRKFVQPIFKGLKRIQRIEYVSEINELV